MPASFGFIAKGDAEQKFVPFNQIDDAMRVHFGAPPDPKRYYRGWYDHIGLALCAGMSLEKIRDEYLKIEEPNGAAICEWLMERYTTEAWYSRY